MHVRTCAFSSQLRHLRGLEDRQIPVGWAPKAIHNHSKGTDTPLRKTFPTVHCGVPSTHACQTHCDRILDGQLATPRKVRKWSECTFLPSAYVRSVNSGAGEHISIGGGPCGRLGWIPGASWPARTCPCWKRSFVLMPARLKLQHVTGLLKVQKRIHGWHKGKGACHVDEELPREPVDCVVQNLATEVTVHHDLRTITNCRAAGKQVYNWTQKAWRRRTTSTGHQCHRVPEAAPATAAPSASART